MSAPMTDLLTRLESGAGGDRELEFAIFKRLHPEYADYVPVRAGGLDHPGDGRDMRELASISVPYYTASLDAALSLVRGMLPGWTFTIYHDGAYVSRSSPPSIEWGRAKTPARSLTAALLRALDQEPQT